MKGRFMETAVGAGRAAGEILLEGRDRALKVDARPRHDVKLELDRESEKVITDILRAAFPDHDILAEESGRHGGASEYEWAIDPLDGTYNFFRGIPFWCTSIGLRQRGEPVLGVVYDPARDELFTAERGGGAHLNGEVIAVSAVAALREATAAVAHGPRGEFTERTALGVTNLSAKCDKVRGLGSAALHLAYVACGRIDGFFEYGIWPWDVTAGAVLIEEAGGRVDLRIRSDLRVETCATNGRIHEAFQAQIAWDAPVGARRRPPRGHRGSAPGHMKDS
jgi:myo-inositol-1(or 4)-monophosphatase